MASLSSGDGTALPRSYTTADDWRSFPFPPEFGLLQTASRVPYETEIRKTPDFTAFNCSRHCATRA